MSYGAGCNQNWITMTQKELILLNFREIRRRSIKLWQGLPDAFNTWRPDEGAMSAIEMIRHVLQADYGWHMIILQADMTDYHTPWDGRAYHSVADEIAFAEPHHRAFWECVAGFTEQDLSERQVIHPGNGQMKPLGQYLLRIGYHESVHAGQFLSYLRAMGVQRPNVWD